MARRLFLTLARRELRGGLKGFRVFIAGLALGVAAIAAVQSVAGAVLDSLRQDGRAILGGDLDLGLIYTPATDEQRAYLDGIAAVAETAEMRAMARRIEDGDSTLIDLKAVDGAYPLYGSIRLVGGDDLAEALARTGGVWGTVVEETLLTRLGLAVGDRVEVGTAELEIRAVIDREPDRVGGRSLSLGPRLMIATEALGDTGLMQPGSMIYYHYRLALPPGVTADAAVAGLRERFPDASWRVRDFTDASPQLARTIGRLALFLTLVGLTALMVGGVGVGNSVRAYLDGRTATIATLKCLGAPSRLVFATYLAQVLAIAAVAIAIGLVVGAAVPLLLGDAIAGALPIDVATGVYPGALALAAVFGVLTTLVFSLWPLARARSVPAAAMFRDTVAPARGWPGAAVFAVTAVLALALAGLAVVTATDKPLAAGFTAGTVAVFLAFRGAAWGIVRLARACGRPRVPALRLALANLYRPGAPTAGVVLSLGLGLTVLVAIALVQGNMSREVNETMPEDAPAFFFVDIQQGQVEELEALIAGIEGTGRLERAPSLRGRIVAANGVPAEQALVDPQHDWILRGDRGVTYRAGPRPSDTLVAGQWWPPDYAGPPLLSVYRDVADAFGLGVGDRLTINVLGRDIEAEIANIRDIDWGTLNLNFTLVFSPEPLSAAPHTSLATLQATEAAELPLQRAVTQRFPNITLVRVREALEMVSGILGRIADAVRGTASITVVAGTLVLAGAVAAGHRRRVYDAVVLKVLGATRGDIAKAFLVEYGLLGLVTAVLAGLVGTLAGWAIVVFVLDVGWTFLPSAVVTTAVLCTAITLAFGFVGTWRALGQKAAPLLRNE
ncbi:MAG: FtsX-like permease family protein [Rhodospirillaceae bacterium]|nr:FtsX-like permease family protein [Rhodospirillaceae bacterium]